MQVKLTFARFATGSVNSHVISETLFCSLRNNMFELADRLVGIYKTDNCTKSITINPRSFAESMEVPT